MASGPITSWQIDGETLETAADFIFGGSKITAEGDCSHEKTLTLWKKSYDQPRQHIEKQRHYFANKDPSSQGYGFSIKNLIPGLGRSPEEEKGYPLQYSYLENPHGQRSLAGYNP